MPRTSDCCLHADSANDQTTTQTYVVCTTIVAENNNTPTTCGPSSTTMAVSSTPSRTLAWQTKCFKHIRYSRKHLVGIRISTLNSNHRISPITRPANTTSSLSNFQTTTRLASNATTYSHALPRIKATVRSA